MAQKKRKRVVKRSRFALSANLTRIAELEQRLAAVQAAYAAVITAHMLVLTELTNRVGDAS